MLWILDACYSSSAFFVSSISFWYSRTIFLAVYDASIDKSLCLLSRSRSTTVVFSIHSYNSARLYADRRFPVLMNDNRAPDQLFDCAHRQHACQAHTMAPHGVHVRNKRARVWTQKIKNAVQHESVARTPETLRSVSNSRGGKRPRTELGAHSRANGARANAVAASARAHDHGQLAEKRSAAKES